MHSSKKIQGHTPNKGLGQNFLQDPQVIAQIVQAISPEFNEQIIEIGPGLGALTHALLPHLAELSVIELDPQLAKKWQAHEKVKWLAADALQFNLDTYIDSGSVGTGNISDASESPQLFKIVGNLPYHISSPLLFHYLSFKSRVNLQCFMLQKEVIDRMIAEHNCKDYGRLSIILQANYQMHRVLDVPPTAFFPPPRVDSSVVVMRPKPILINQVALDVFEQKTFNDLLAKVTQICFSQRRKMLRAMFKNHADDLFAQSIQKICIDLDMDLSLRPENISLNDYLKITEKLYFLK